MPADTPDAPDGDDSTDNGTPGPPLVTSDAADGAAVTGDTASASDELERTTPATSFKPASFLDALRSVVQPRGPRATRAQPATGTEADAKAVNFVDRRERLIGIFLSVFQALLGVVIYAVVHSEIEHPSTKKPKISIAQAHRDTLSLHYHAPWFLIINLVLALAIAGGVLSKRRALLGFTILLGGLGMNASGGGILGIVYLGVGIWLVFRSMRRSSAAQGSASTAKAGTAGAAGARAGGARAGAGASSGRRPATDTVGPRTPAQRRAAAAAAASATRKPPAPSKRYTPPAPRRPAPPKPAVAAEPEKESRLTSWLRR